MPSVLTPKGYKDIADCHVGEILFAYSPETRRPLQNNIQSLKWMTREEYRASNQGGGAPFADYMPFSGYRINGKWTLFQDQSIWRNGLQVCHVSDLVVGDTIYDENDDPILVKNIEEVCELDGWWHFKVSGDHSYVVDGLTLHNASRFWVGSGSANTWAATANTNWASSSGGANNATVPGTSDAAFFDANSGTGNSVIGASITIQNLDCNNYTGTLTHNTAVTLTLNSAGSPALRFGSGMTYTPASTTSLITFTLTSGTATVTCNGKSMAAMTVNGAGGTVQPVDTLLVNAVASAIITLTAGTLDAATNTAPITAILVSGSNSNTRSLLLGGTVTLGGNVSGSPTLWTFSTVTGLTFTKNSANFVVLSPTTQPSAGWGWSGGGLTYNNLTLNTTGNSNYLLFNGNCTFANLTHNAGWSLAFTTSTILTVNNPPTFNATQTQPCFLMGQTTGSISVPSGTVNLKWGAICDVPGIGGATFIATDTFGIGLNSGWSISPPADSALTPAAIATAVWQDTTAGDFTVASSIGKSLYTTGNAPGAASGLSLVGSNMGSVTSVSGSVGSISGITFPTRFASLAIDASGFNTFNNTSIATVTNLTNAPTSGDLTATMKASVTTAATAATPTIAGYTGNTPQTGDAYARLGAAGAGLTALGDTRIAHLDADVSSRLATSGYTAPDNSDITAIKAKTDNLPASPAATGAAMTLTSAYDAAKSASSQSSVDSVNSFNASLVQTAGKLWVLDENGNPLGSPVAAIKAKTDNLPTDPASESLLIAALGAIASSIAVLPTAEQNADELLTSDGAIDGLTPQQALRIIAAALVGKASGLGTTAVTFRAVDDSSDRAVGTVDNVGNRTSVTLTPGT